jgi:anaerobic selenocysteine-containing dehydrogenase
VPVDAPQLPAPDSYSLRLVSTRRLYDHGVLLQSCRSLAPLAPAATVRAHSSELGRLGVTTSDRVRVRSSRAAAEFEAVADDGVPRGVLCIDFNLVGDDGGVDHGGASALIDVSEPVVDVRLETL